jgi:hypothetical protein
MSENKIEIRLHNNESGELYLNLQDFSEFLDVSMVRSYEILVQEDQKALKIRFFDENKKLIKLI